MMKNPTKAPVELDEYTPLTEKIIGCAFRVSNELGPGFLEKVYENALSHEFSKMDIPFQRQVHLVVQYDGVVVGDYIADFVIDDRVILELKAIKSLDETHEAQGINYLKATSLRLCLLLNFGTRRIQIKRLAN